MWQLKQEPYQTLKKPLDPYHETIIECADDIFKQSQAMTCKSLPGFRILTKH